MIRNLKVRFAKQQMNEMERKFFDAVESNDVLETVFLLKRNPELIEKRNEVRRQGRVK